MSSGSLDLYFIPTRDDFICKVQSSVQYMYIVTDLK